MDLLSEIRASAPLKHTSGLSDSLITKFLGRDSTLALAITDAYAQWKKVSRELKEDHMTEEQLIADICINWCHFYPPDTRNPYVPLAAKGPWLVTLYGSVLHDSGGYGMLGFGHNPDTVAQALASPQVMANIMTPSISQMTFMKKLRHEIGHLTRKGTEDNCPFSQFLMMNSGSEANSVAARIIDVRTGMKAEGRKVVAISLKGSFHGRTFRPALWTDSCAEGYYRNACHHINEARKEYIRTVPPNDCEALKAQFKECEDKNEYVEGMFMEAVMGEGNPGNAITREFYELARSLTKKSDSILLVDSIQAGVRCTGALSIVDYPGFEGIEAPDCEVYSKAVNAGQYPVSLLAMGERAFEFYRHGIYGNTMTGNPRGCDVCSAVLDMLPLVRNNIRTMGKYAVERFENLRLKFPSAITHISGTGLLYAVHLDKNKFPVVAVNGAEYWLRQRGIGVIHGGVNALRFTPHFRITQEEIDLQVSAVGNFLTEFHGLLPTLEQMGSQSQDLSELSPSSYFGSSNKRMLTLTGHLFDSQLVNEVLNEVERFSGTCQFSRLRLGSNVGEESEITMEVRGKPEDSAVLDTIVDSIKSLTEKKKCACELVTEE